MSDLIFALEPGSIQDILDGNKNIINSINDSFDTLWIQLLSSAAYRAIVSGCMAIAGFTLAFRSVKEIKAWNDGVHSGQNFLQSFLVLTLMSALLIVNVPTPTLTNSLGTIVTGGSDMPLVGFVSYSIRAIGNNINSSIIDGLTSEMGKDAAIVSTMIISADNITSNAIQNCSSEKSVSVRKACFQRSIDELNKINSFNATNNVDPLQVNNLKQKVTDNITQLEKLRDSDLDWTKFAVALLKVLPGMGSVSLGIDIGQAMISNGANIAIGIITVVLFNIGAAFNYALELVLMLNGLIAPLALSMSYLPIPSQPMWIWLNGVIGIFVIKITYSIVVVLAGSMSLLSAGAMSLVYPIIIGLIAPALALLIGTFSANAILSGGASAITTISSGGLSMAAGTFNNFKR